MLAQRALQQFGRTVKGKTQMTDEPFAFHAHRMFPAAESFVALPVAVVDAMHEVKIEITCACTLKLLLKGGIHVFSAGQKVMRHLGGERECLPGVTFYKGVSYRAFRGAVVIDVGGIKIGKAGIQKAVYHLT